MASSFFRVDELARERTRPLLDEIFENQLGAAVVPHVLPEQVCESWVERLEAGALPQPPTRFAAEFDAFSIGPCLDQCEGDVAGYLGRVDSYERALRAAVPETDVLELLVEQLARLSVRRLVRPRASDGRPYALATLRRIAPGGYIPPHCENEQLPRSAYDEFRQRLDTRALVSFFLTLRPADAGGELSIHDLGFDALTRSVHGHSDMAAEVERAARVLVSPPTGALIVFNGGPRFHQVLPVRGPRSRWTLGGFVAQSADRAACFVWA